VLIKTNAYKAKDLSADIFKTAEQGSEPKEQKKWLFSTTFLD